MANTVTYIEEEQNRINLSNAYPGPDPNVTLPGGLRHDFITIPIIMWPTIIIYLAWALFLFVMIIIRRNKQPVKVRGWPMMVLSLFTSTFFIVFNSIRVGIGRSLFPCLLFTIFFSYMPSLLFAPVAIRTWRLVMLYLLNFIKRLTIKKDMIFVMNQIETSSTVSTGEETMPIEASAKDKYITGETKDVEADIANANKGNSTSRNNVWWPRLLRIMRIITSDLFIFFIFIALLIVQAPIVIGFMASDPSKYFNVSHGCVTDMKALIVIAVFAFFPLATVLVLLIPLFFVRDTWHLRNETLLNILQWGIFLVAFLILGQIDFVVETADYYVPYGAILYISAFFDNVITIFVPLVASFIMERRQNRHNIYRKSRSSSSSTKGGDRRSTVSNPAEELEYMIENADFVHQFERYCQRSFAPEPLLCWQALDKFLEVMVKYPAISTRRRQMGRDIYHQFLKEDAQYQLNIPASIRSKKWIDILTMPDLEGGDKARAQEIVELQVHCRADMLNTYFRYRLTKECIKIRAKMEVELKARNDLVALGRNADLLNT